MSVADYYACSPIPGESNVGKWHDWRLWERKPLRVLQPDDSWLPAWHETWYCTRCRIIEERTTDP